MAVDTLIRSIGQFWKAEDVFWGTQKNPGSLLGVPAKASKQGPFDFREQSGIYVLYSDYHLVYVGQTGSKDQKLLKRLNKHRSDDLAGRWDRFSWFGLRAILKQESLSKENKAAHPSLSTILNQIEGVLIHACEPQLNSQEADLVLM